MQLEPTPPRRAAEAVSASGGRAHGVADPVESTRDFADTLRSARRGGDYGAARRESSRAHAQPSEGRARHAKGRPAHERNDEPRGRGEEARAAEHSSHQAAPRGEEDLRARGRHPGHDTEGASDGDASASESAQGDAEAGVEVLGKGAERSQPQPQPEPQSQSGPQSQSVAGNGQGIAPGASTTGVARPVAVVSSSSNAASACTTPTSVNPEAARSGANAESAGREARARIAAPSASKHTTTASALDDVSLGTTPDAEATQALTARDEGPSASRESAVEHGAGGARTNERPPPVPQRVILGDPASADASAPKSAPQQTARAALGEAEQAQIALPSRSAPSAEAGPGDHAPTGGSDPARGSTRLAGSRHETMALDVEQRGHDGSSSFDGSRNGSRAGSGDGSPDGSSADGAPNEVAATSADERAAAATRQTRGDGAMLDAVSGPFSRAERLHARAAAGAVAQPSAATAATADRTAAALRSGDAAGHSGEARGATQTPGEGIPIRLAATRASLDGIAPESSERLPSWVTRVREGLRAAGRRAFEMRIELDPPSLGHIDVRLRILGGEVRAVVSAEQEATRGLLAEQRQIFERALAREALDLRGFDVDVETGSGSGSHSESERADRAAHALGFIGSDDDHDDPVPLARPESSSARAPGLGLSVRV
jgi:hypothetical protein